MHLKLSSVFKVGTVYILCRMFMKLAQNRSRYESLIARVGGSFEQHRGQEKKPSNYITPLITNSRKQKVIGKEIRIWYRGFNLHETFNWQVREKDLIGKQKPVKSYFESYIYFPPSIIDWMVFIFLIDDCSFSAIFSSINGKTKSVMPNFLYANRGHSLLLEINFERFFDDRK